MPRTRLTLIMRKPAGVADTTHYLITIPQHRHRRLRTTSLLTIPLHPRTQAYPRRRHLLIPTTTRRRRLMGTLIEIETESVASGTSGTPGATGIED